MDQVKDILKQAIKYRFWIAVGISAILPMIAYFVGSGPIKAKTIEETKNITAADTDVKKYAAGVVPNESYKRLVNGKTEELASDVDKSWKKLYARQAPLLTWPEVVSKDFTKWGRAWPEGTDSSYVQSVVTDYINAYPQYVTEVYKSFKPFDPMEGTGIVSAPPEAVLLRPATFTIDAPPSLGKIWSAQERLWIQRTLLDVVSSVNKDAKDWDGATIKQVNLLDVGTPSAQDQRSAAKGDTLEEAPDVVDPSKPVEEEEESAGGSMMETMMRGKEGMMGGGRGGAAAAPPEIVQYIHTESSQFKIMPVMMKVLVEQDRIQDFLTALSNSPMNIQVRDFEMAKPQVRVVKPEKGAMMAGGFGGFGSMGMGMRGGEDMMGMGGGMANMAGMMRGMGGAGRGMSGYGGSMSRGMGSMMSMMGGGRGAGMGMGRGMGMGMAPPEKKGNDKRGENRAKKAEDEINAVKNAVHTSLHDPYYNIVEVTVYGQVRFFNPPPAEAPAEPSQSETAAEGEEGAPKAEGENPEAKKDVEPAAEGEAKAEAPKPEGEDKAEPKAEEEAKPEAPAAEPKGDEAPKAEVPAPKDEAPKAEAPAPKAEAPAPKGDTPKEDAPK